MGQHYILVGILLYRLHEMACGHKVEKSDDARENVTGTEIIIYNVIYHKKKKLIFNLVKKHPFIS